MLKVLSLISIFLISIALYAQNPGGVSSAAWYKAGAGVSSTTNGAQTYQWNNQAGGSNNCWVPSGNLYFQDNAADNINFNPSISFNGSSYFGTNRLPITNSDFSIIGVGLREDNGQNILIGDDQSNGNNKTITFGYTANTTHTVSFGNQALNTTVNAYDTPSESPFLMSLLFNSNSGRTTKEFRNGVLTLGSDTRKNTLGGFSNMRIGSSITAGSDHFNGNISEVIVFGTVLTNLEELQVYSYLALKYGLMLTNDQDGDASTNEIISGLVREGDMVASDGSTIVWNYGLQTSAYFNDVAGIARDDNSALNQKQSKSINSTGMVTMALGSVATTNSANVNSFSADKSFLLWGHNAGTNAFTSTGAPSGREILGRQWRVQETGTVGSVKIQIPASTSSNTTTLPAAGSLDLLVDDDGDFTSGAGAYQMTLVGTNWEVTVDLSTGQYFSFAPGLASFEVTTNGNEAGPVDIVFTLTLPSVNSTGNAFTFDISDNGTGSAVAGLDYNAIPNNAQISVANGALIGTYTLTVINDASTEPPETMSASLSNPSGSAFSIDPSNEAVATIIDDDGGPGGVRTNLNIWLKADLGAGSTDNVDVTSWTDQSFLGHNGTSDGNPPSYRNNLTDNLNYNPVVLFDGSDDRLVLDLTDIKDGNGNGNGRFSIFGVGERTDNGTNLVIGSPDYNYNGKVHFGYLNDGSINFNNNAALSISTNSYSVPEISPFLLYVTSTGSGRVLEEQRDGVFRRNTDSYTGKIQVTSSNYIGAIPSASAYFKGPMTEVIVYEDEISDLEKAQIYSYLSLKYGLQQGDDNNGNSIVNETISGLIKEGDYVASDGSTVFWDYAAHTATYYNGVAGIGRDDASALEQKQSKSAEQDALIAIALDSLEASNTENLGSFSSDLSFLMWGNDQGSVTFTSIGAPTGKTILGRKWKVQETGSIGSVYISIPASTSSSTYKLPFTDQTVQIFQDADGDFTSGTIGTTLALNGNNWEGRVDFTNGEYFSFGESPTEANLSVTVTGEENGPVAMEFTVSLSVPNTTGSAITFDFDDLGTGTATSGLDYTAVAGAAQISIADGASSGSITITVIDDALSEVIETFDAQISNPSSSTVFIGTASASAFILDNDNGPAGITNNLRLWLRPDEGTSTTANNTFLNTWSDQSGNSNDATQDGTPPAYLDNSADNINFHPTVDFDGTDDRLVVDLSAIKGSSYTLFVVGERDDASANYAIGSEGGNKNSDLYFGYRDALTATLSQWNNDLDLTVSSYNSPGITPYILMGRLSTSDRIVEEIRDAGFKQDQNTNLTELKGSKTNYIGDLESEGNYDGRISEVIAYSDFLSIADRQKVYTYLGLKYGIQLPADNNANNIANEVLNSSIREGDYVSSSDVVIWEYAAGSSYFNNVAGIGRDDLGGLNQKQSQSMQENALITVGLGTIQSSNEANANLFSADESFLVWGNDNGALTFSTTGAPASKEILGRTWYIQETGTVGAVKIRIPASTSTAATTLPAADIVELLVNNTANFSAPSSSINMTLVGTNWEATVDLADGDFITFAHVIVTASLAVKTDGAEAGPTDIEMEVTLSTTNNTGAAITFDFDDLGTGTATAGSDYSSVSSTAKISVANGSATGITTVTVIDDADLESTETVDFQISNPSNGSVSIAQATSSAQIIDNEAAPVVEAPGGVSDQLIFWLKADTGTSSTTDGASVVTWSDQTGNGHDATNNGTAPLYELVKTNYHPAIDFSNATSGGYRIANDATINASTAGAKSYTIAFTTGSDVTTRQVIYEQGGGTNGMNLYILNGELVANIWNNSVDNAIATGIESDQTYVVTYIFDGSVGAAYLYANGSLAGSDLAVFATLKSHTGAIGLGKIVSATQFDGQVDVSANEGFLGSIMEMSYYDEKALTSTERQQIESYLAIKYGVGLSQDYIASDGVTVIWDASANTGFNNNITGIGLDNTSTLNQKQSVSSQANDIVAIGLGSLATSNAANANSFSTDNSFLLWGDNNSAVKGVEVNTDLVPQSGDVDQLKKKWKLTESNTVGSVQFVFNKDSIDAAFPNISLGDVFLKMADDSTLATNATYTALLNTTINNIDSYVASMDVSGTQYFTVVQNGFIVWNGTEWRGGLSVSGDYNPSDEAGEATKTMYIQEGDSALATEPISVANVVIDTAADLIISPRNCLNVSGTFTNNGGFILIADSNGYAQYKGPAVTSTFQQYTNTEGWHLISSPFSNTTFDDLTFKDDNGFINHPIGGVSLDSCDYCNLWQYDPSTYNGQNIGFSTSNAYGTWRSSASSTQSFGTGWNLYLDEAGGFAAAPWTLQATGTLNVGSIDQIVNENNGGWNLVGNPYPSTIDWDEIEGDLAAAGIANGVHIWDEANGNYAVYASGVGTNNLTPFIAPFQSFYVQTAVEGLAGSGDVFRTFSLTEADRPDFCPVLSADFYKTAASDNQLLLQSTHLGSGKKDQTIVLFDENGQRAFNQTEDVRKLFSDQRNSPLLYSMAGSTQTAINKMEGPVFRDSVLLGLRVAAGSSVKIELLKSVNGFTVLLEDIKTGKWYNIEEEAAIVEHDPVFAKRFWLHFGPHTFNPTLWKDNDPFYIYQEDGNLTLKTRKSVQQGKWYINGINSGIIHQGAVNASAGQTQSISLQGLTSGVYIFILQDQGKTYSRKIVVMH